MSEQCIRKWLTVTQGLRGWFAVLMGEFKDERTRTYIEPISTSPFAFKTADEARNDAKQWAESEYHLEVE